MTFIYFTFLFIFILICILTVFVILIQDSKTSSLGSAFGADSSDSLFGTQTAEVVRKFTSYLIFIFMLSSLILSLWTSAIGRGKIISPDTSIEEIAK